MKMIKLMTSASVKRKTLCIHIYDPSYGLSLHCRFVFAEKIRTSKAALSTVLLILFCAALLVNGFLPVLDLTTLAPVPGGVATGTAERFGCAGEISLVAKGCLFCLPLNFLKVRDGLWIACTGRLPGPMQASTKFYIQMRRH